MIAKIYNLHTQKEYSNTTLTCNETPHDGHSVGGQRPRLVAADRSCVAHRFAGVEMSDEILVVHHFLSTQKEHRERLSDYIHLINIHEQIYSTVTPPTGCYLYDIHRQVQPTRE